MSVSSSTHVELPAFCSRSHGSTGLHLVLHGWFVTKAYGLLEEQGKIWRPPDSNEKRPVTLPLCRQAPLQALTGHHSSMARCLQDRKERTDEDNMIFVQDRNLTDFEQYKIKFY